MGESFIEIFFSFPYGAKTGDWIVWCVYYFVSFSVFFQDIFDLEIIVNVVHNRDKMNEIAKAEMCIFQLMTL